VNLQRVWRWHDEPALIAAAATPWGRLLVWLAAVVLLPGSHRIPVALVLAPALVWPERRVELLAVGALGTLWGMISRGAGPVATAHLVLSALVVLVILFGCWQAAHRFKQLPWIVRRYPIAATHVVLLGIVGLTVVVRHWMSFAEGSALDVLSATLELVLPFLVWRVSYLMLAGRRGTAAKHRFWDHLFYLVPLWGGSRTPYGKGHGYLMERRVEGATELAATRLAGIKLLGLAWIWAAVHMALAAGVHGEDVDGFGFLVPYAPGLARLPEAVLAGPASYGLLERWAIVFVYLVEVVLGIAIVGHTIIGALRLFGFRVFRNTYKPLLATTVVDFWNRYYFYFKELLVEFYFYPAYVATSRFGARTRMFLSIMAAACVGNLYYHVVIRDFHKYFLVAAPVMWERLASRTLYSVVLGFAIFISMRREQARRGKVAAGSGALAMLRRMRAMVGVWIVFGVLQVWITAFTINTFGQRARYTLGLVGITFAGDASAPPPATRPAQGPAEEGT
jgi:hypothetical protein